MPKKGVDSNGYDQTAKSLVSSFDTSWLYDYENMATTRKKDNEPSGLFPLCSSRVVYEKIMDIVLLN